MENYKDIIIRPIITEKGNQQNTCETGRGSYLRC